MAHDAEYKGCPVRKKEDFLKALTNPKERSLVSISPLDSGLRRLPMQPVSSFPPGVYYLKIGGKPVQVRVTDRRRILVE